MRRALAPVAFAALLICALSPAARSDGESDAYAALVPLAGESHQHAATLYLAERLKREPPVPRFERGLHEHGDAAAAWAAMRKGGYDWGSLAFHDTNFPGLDANIALEPASAKYRWWARRVSPAGFFDATSSTGASVDPPSSESLALARLATARTVEGEGGFLAFAGREFTDVADTPKGVRPRMGGHKILILPPDAAGMCADDGSLGGDEYCRDEYRLYRWLVSAGPPQGIAIQAHPGNAHQMDLRPVHPKHAPGGFGDAFVQGIELGTQLQDPQYEANYQVALRKGWRLFPAFGSDSHNAGYPGSEASLKKGATICWASARTRVALLEAMHARRCYFSATYAPELRFSARATGSAAWLLMGGRVDSTGGKLDVRVRAVNDPRNPRRFDVLELVDAQNGRVLRSCGARDSAQCRCERRVDGADLCELTADGLRIADGAFYARVRTLEPDPAHCKSKATPALLPHCGISLVSSAIYVNWSAYLARLGQRACRFDAASLPCEKPGCLPLALDRDQDGYPDRCDVCPELFDPEQADANLDGRGDACAKR